jgi:hypothetical protein
MTDVTVQHNAARLRATVGTVVFNKRDSDTARPAVARWSELDGANPLK